MKKRASELKIGDQVEGWSSHISGISAPKDAEYMSVYLADGQCVTVSKNRSTWLVLESDLGSDTLQAVLRIIQLSNALRTTGLSDPAATEKFYAECVEFYTALLQKLDRVEVCLELADIAYYAVKRFVNRQGELGALLGCVARHAKEVDLNLAQALEVCEAKYVFRASEGGQEQERLAVEAVLVEIEIPF